MNGRSLTTPYFKSYDVGAEEEPSISTNIFFRGYAVQYTIGMRFIMKRLKQKNTPATRKEALHPPELLHLLVLISSYIYCREILSPTSLASLKLYFIHVR